MIRIETILSILGILITLPGVASVFPFIDATAKIAILAALLLSAVGCRTRLALPAVFQTALTVVAFIYYGAHYSRDNLVGPSVNLLVVLLAVRLTGAKSTRHYLQMFVLSLFILAGSSLYSLDAVFLVYLLLLLFLIGGTLVILTFYSSENSMTVSSHQLKRIVSVSLLLPAGTLPLMLFFFVIMPRMQYPMWNVAARGQTRTTGFSEKVTPGGSAAVEESRTVAFRATAPNLDPHNLYWRGIVLNTFKDGSWLRDEPSERRIAMPAGGGMVRIDVFPELQRTRYLIGLNAPVNIEGVRAHRSSDLVFTGSVSPGRRVRYTSVSVPGGFLKSDPGLDARFYLRLPDRLPPKIAALGLRLARKNTTSGEKLAAAENFYRNARIRYATSGLPTGVDALDDFLFGSRVGHCELFASSLAIILRSAGVPCRLVGGYYGGIYNDVGGYYVVTEDMAHVWVEVLIAGKGWITVDPSSWGADFAQRLEKAEVGRLRMLADAASYFWNITVINYDLDKQVHLLNSSAETMRRIDGRKAITAGLLLVLAAGLVYGSVFFLRRKGSTEQERLLQQLLATVAERHGVEKEPSAGLFEFSTSVGSPHVDEFVRIYCRAVYHDRELGKDDLQRLHSLIRMIGKEERTASVPLRKNSGL